MIQQIQRAVSARAKTPDFIALTEPQYLGLLREVAPLCTFPSDGGGDSLMGIPIVMAGSHAHEMRLLRGEVGINVDPSMGQGVGRQPQERERP